MARTAIPFSLLGFIAGGLLIWLVVQFSEKDEQSGTYIPLGRKILEDYSCGEGEKKHVYIKGIIDDFSTAGVEPTLDDITPIIAESWQLTQIEEMRADYDAFSADTYVVEVFTLPTDIASARFVTAMRSLTRGSDTDILILGNMFGNGNSNDFARPAVPEGYGDVLPITQFGFDDFTGYTKLHDYTVDGTTTAIDFRDMRLTNVPDGRETYSDKTLRDLIQDSPGGEFTLTVYLQDDHTVDYYAIALCERPPRDKGGTFVSASSMLEDRGWHWDSAALTCVDDTMGCNLDKGDTACDTMLPLACFRDDDLPLPESYDGTPSNWSRGRIGLTQPVAGSSFTTLADAHAFCETTYGEGWRTLSGYESGGSLIIAMGEPIPQDQRVWINTPGAPYGACWRRQ